MFHRYILGVYDLYDRLTRKFPYVLFESCASGGARFDPGMLYYAPQAWTSDDTDAVERLKIQYGTSYCYPCQQHGKPRVHLSQPPDRQGLLPLHTRANVACFGTFGYELDLNTPDSRGAGGGEGPDPVHEGVQGISCSSVPSTACRAPLREM